MEWQWNKKLISSQAKVRGKATFTKSGDNKGKTATRWLKNNNAVSGQNVASVVASFVHA